MTIEAKFKSLFAAFALAFAMILSGPMHTGALADGMTVSDDDDDDDHGDSEDHANDQANENATGNDDVCGDTVENSRC